MIPWLSRLSKTSLDVVLLINSLKCSQLRLDIQRGFGLQLISAKYSTFEAFLGGWSNTLGHLPHCDGRPSSICDNLKRVNNKQHAASSSQ